MSWFRIIFLFLCSVFIGSLMLFTACSNNMDVSGGTGAETENGISGVVKENGKAVPGVIVSLYPQSYDPVNDSGTIIIQDTTDENGNYFYSLSSSGSYTISAVNPFNQTTALISGINYTLNDTLIQAPEAELHSPGLLIVPLKELDTDPNGYIYIPGTEIFHVLDSMNIVEGLITLEIPSAPYTLINYVNPDHSEIIPLIQDSIIIIPNDTATLNPYFNWTQKFKLKINTSVTGADIQNHLYSIPILIRLNSQNAPLIFSNSNVDGSDIRFLKSDDKSLLSHEFERWDPVNKLAEIWISLDTLIANNDSQYIYIYSGNLKAKVISNNIFVFDSTLMFKGVYHMDELIIQNDSILKDATPNFNHGYLRGTSLPVGSLSPINLGIELNGIDQYVFFPKITQSPSEFTISFWVNTTTKTGGRIIGIGDSYPFIADSNQAVDRWIWMDDSGLVHFGMWDNDTSTEVNTLTTTTTLNDGNWYHVSTSFSPAGQFLYINGSLNDFDTDLSGITLWNFQGYWNIGHFIKQAETDTLTAIWPSKPTSNFFGGKLDEVRIEYTIRDSNWIRFNYKNQKSNSEIIKID